MGPTASGKTALALKLCDAFPCDIISVDSALIYRGMDIGTAKPDAATLQRYPHRLINMCDPATSYSAAQFCQDAKQEIRDIIMQGRIPLLVGGTMLYFRALQQGLSLLPAADKTIRKKLTRIIEQQGLIALGETLRQVDPTAAARIHPNDSQRIQRALEVFMITGKTLTELQLVNRQPAAENYQFINVGLLPEDRSLLHQRITERFADMLANGLLNEVTALYHRNDLHQQLPAMRTVGYRQIWQYLSGEYDAAQMQQHAIAATRQLAKRQMTWLRSWPQLHSFGNTRDAYKGLTKILAGYF